MKGGGVVQDRVRFAPAFSVLEVELEAGEAVVAEKRALVCMDAGIAVRSIVGMAGIGLFARIGGIFGAFLRKLFGREGFFMNRYTAEREGKVVLAPAMLGEVVRKELLEGKALVISRSAYLASTGNLRLRTAWGGWRTLLGGEGVFLLRAEAGEGGGCVWLNAYGGVQEIRVERAMPYVLDTGHLCCFEGSLRFRPALLGGWRDWLFGGEGMIMNFSGEGSLYLQTHKMRSLVAWLKPYFSGEG
jgi:uncharacterized protein (TIGR00266 family)